MSKEIIPEHIRDVQVPLDDLLVKGMTLDALGLLVWLRGVQSINGSDKTSYYSAETVFGKEAVDAASEKLLELNLVELKEE